MAQQEINEFVVSMMRSAKVTDNEARAFMGTALARIEAQKPGQALVFMKELIAKRATRDFPDVSRWMR